MKRNLLVAITMFFLMSSLGFGQTKFKEFVWEEVGLEFSIPSFIKVNSKDKFMIELESEDFLIYVELKDDFEDLDELVDYYEIKQITNEIRGINKPTYKGESIAGFIETIESGDEVDIYNYFGNFESKFNDNERIAFDISVYEWNDRIEEYVNQIINSIQFFKIKG
jgi:hypothetical protein